MRKFTINLMALLAVMLLMPDCLKAATTIAYDFREIHNGNDVTLTAGVSSVTNNSTATNIPAELLQELGGRFSMFFRGECVWKITSDGLSMTGSKDTYLSILNLVAGDKVIVTLKSGQVLFTEANSTGVYLTSSSSYSEEAEGTPAKWDQLISGNEYVVTADGSVNLQAKKSATIIQKIEIITEQTETVTSPTIQVIGASGINRTVEIVPGASSLGNDVNTYYTLDGTEPNENSTKYTEPFSVSEVTSVKAITISNNTNVKSETITVEVSAGVELPLAKPVLYVASMIESEGFYVPTFNASIDNSSVIGKPAATITAKFIPVGGAAKDVTLPYTPTEDGVIALNAVSEGYESSNYSKDVIAKYVKANYTSDFTTVNNTNIAEELGADWAVSTSGTRWANWSKTGGINADGTSNNGADYYTAVPSSETVIYDFLKVSNNATLLIGYGFGNGTNTSNYTIENALDNSIAEFVLTSYGSNPYSSFVVEENNTLSINVPKYEKTLKQALYYIPYKETTVSISTSGYATFSSTNDVDFSSAEGLTVYTAKLSSDNTKVSLTKIDGVVPANTGVILMGTAGETYTGTITTGAAAVENNDLKANSTDISGNGSIYVLNKDVNNVAGFYKLATAGTLAAGKAYLEIPNSDAKTISIVWNETTGIEENYEFGNMNSDAATYDLSGRKVANPAKGLYIKNGKKFIVK
ncbi:MAG: chitobiase/beta-hexosaminidase C-terminal domain-containing protein [Prevotella sp.]|nr:chitobiase/beta-hexosaminidase C-terminal domain-containing protein [Prevotella sp.]